MRVGDGTILRPRAVDCERRSADVTSTKVAISVIQGERALLGEYRLPNRTIWFLNGRRVQIPRTGHGIQGSASPMPSPTRGCCGRRESVTDWPTGSSPTSWRPARTSSRPRQNRRRDLPPPRRAVVPRRPRPRDARPGRPRVTSARSDQLEPHFGFARKRESAATCGFVDRSRWTEDRVRYRAAVPLQFVDQL